MYIWCADVQVTDSGLLAASGAYEDISSAWDSTVVPSSCGRGYVIVRADQFNAVANTVNSGSGGTGTTTPPAISSFTADEVAALKYQAANPSPFNLSLVDGALVSVAILAVWGSAAVIKTIRQMISGGDSSE